MLLAGGAFRVPDRATDGLVLPILLVTAAFVSLLAIGHWLDRSVWTIPLSTLRDGPHAVAGYVLFSLLRLVGVLHVRLYWRAGLLRDAVPPAAALVLLAVVAVTPSFDTLHGMAAFLLLGLAFFTYAGKLLAAGSLWLFAHIAVPVALMLVAGFGAGLSYGVWQKGLILYFLLAVNVDVLLATGGPGWRRPARKPRRKTAYAPRVVWRRHDG